ncbi:MAG: DUF928 domain-containing protein [Thermosynechococcaceae cyanobacterium MS004]|nr:DUF928 domain-containing protein [Thermosynechococcaceae cyanobacterium MS004]
MIIRPFFALAASLTVLGLAWIAIPTQGLAAPKKTVVKPSVIKSLVSKPSSVNPPLANLPHAKPPNPTFSAPISPKISRPAPSTSSSPKAIFTPPPHDQKPAQTVGAGVRGIPCGEPVPYLGHESPSEISDPAIAPQTRATQSSQQLGLRALIPSGNQGLTVAAHPSFWIYLPKTTASQVVLSIREEGGAQLSQTFFDLAQQSGVVSLALPETTPALEVGKTYQWAAVLVCGEQPSPNDPVVVSWVRRVAPTHSVLFNNISEDSAVDNAVEQAQAYGQQGIWFDALTTLAQARRSQPHRPELVTAWTDFLTSAGLETLASEPLQD